MHMFVWKLHRVVGFISSCRFVSNLSEATDLEFHLACTIGELHILIKNNYAYDEFESNQIILFELQTIK